jgi:hypothetical protein
MQGDEPHFEASDIEVVSRAFVAACEDLNLGDRSLDVSGRERLAALIVRLAKQGERNVDALHRRAVMYFRSTEEWHARTARAETSISSEASTGR